MSSKKDAGLFGDDERREIELRARAVLKGELRVGPNFSLSELKLESDGVLLIRGDVESVAVKKIALRHVANVPNIVGIADHLHVRPAVAMKDDEIRVHVRSSLIQDVTLEGIEIRDFDAGAYQLVRGAPLGKRGEIGIEVRNGVVILTGNAPSLTSKRLAGVIAWWVPGVRDVVNGLAVEPPEEDGPDRIAEAVRAVLEKDAFINASQVRVGVRNTLVRLTGVVPNEKVREAAERDAWMILGVDDVANEISIGP